MKYSLIFFLLIYSQIQASIIKGKIVHDTTNKPIIEATVISDTASTKTDTYGDYELESNNYLLKVRAPGYERKEATFIKNIAIGLKQQNIRALYVSYWALAAPKYMREIDKLIEQSDVNALVVDIKNEQGYLAFKGNVKLAKEIGTYKRRVIRDIKKFVSYYKKKDVYLIARMSLFKDNLLPNKRVNLAVKLGRGKIYINKEGMSWSDPYSKEVQNYNIELAKEVASIGFDEINFDYIRFPARTGLVFSKLNSHRNRQNAIETFLKKVRNELDMYNVFLSVDTFGHICWNYKETQIGQNMKTMSKYVDYISPMLYPSGFAPGVGGIDNPVNKPYEIVYKSLIKAHQKTGIKHLQFRPWLQAFRDYSYNRKHFSTKEIQAQIGAANDAKSSGWMLWHAASRYNLENLTLIPHKEIKGIATSRIPSSQNRNHYCEL